MNILITGNMGYVGSVLAPFLRLHCPASRLIGWDAGYFADLVRPENRPEASMDWQIQGDVRMPPEELFLGVDAVIHLAAISNDPMGERFEQVTKNVNEDSTARLALMAWGAGVKRFIFASSCSVYGAEGDGPKNELSGLNPLTAYARSKVNAEQEILRLASPSFKVYPLRFATACGSSPRLRLDLVLNDFVASAVTTGVVNVLSDGSPWRPLIHVHDMCRAILWALLDQWGLRSPLNVGSNESNFQVRELAEAVAKQTGAELRINTEAAPDRRSYRVDFNLFKNLAPDYYPVVTLDEAVRDLATWFRNAGPDTVTSTFRDDGRFNRLAHLNNLVTAGRLDQNLIWTGGNR